jgi:hypothetical protein
MEQGTRSAALRLVVAFTAAVALLGASSAVAGATATVIYNNIATPLPANVPSEAFEATQTSQFGGQVEFAGPSKSATQIAVGMSSWGCQTGAWFENNCATERGAKFEWPVTLRVYLVGPANAVGTQIAEVTKTFKMPYRPSASPKCTGESAGGWYRKGECFHGRLFKITFTMRGVTLPSKAIISVSYNTSDYGSEPQRPKPCNATTAGCPYDSLNVGLTEPTKFNVKEEPEPVPPSVGSDPAPESAYQNSQTAGQYCDKGLGGTGTFRLDSGVPPCWTGYQPLFTVSTK